MGQVLWVRQGQGEWFVGQWVVGIISFQRIFGLCGHIVENWQDVTIVHCTHRWTECEDTVRVLDSELAMIQFTQFLHVKKKFTCLLQLQLQLLQMTQALGGAAFQKSLNLFACINILPYPNIMSIIHISNENNSVLIHSMNTTKWCFYIIYIHTNLLDKEKFPMWLGAECLRIGI